MSSGRDGRVAAIFSLIALAANLAAWTLKGPEVGKWTLIGTLGTAGYLGGTWIGIRLAGQRGENPRRGAAALLMVFILKVPPIVLLAIAAREAPAEVRDGLLYGAAVVYCLLIGWALLPRPSAKPLEL